MLRRIVPFCSHCGKLAETGRPCPACGAPVAPDAVVAMMGEMRRHRAELRILAALLVVVAGVTLWAIRHSIQAKGAAANSTSIQQQGAVASAPGAESSSAQGAAGEPAGGQVEGGGPTPAAEPGREHSSLSGITGVDQMPQAPANPVVDAPVRSPETGAATRSHSPAADASEGRSGSDQYPGSQAMEVPNANLPDIGVPVASDVYATSDSPAKVLSYYRQRYPDATVSEVNGQQVLAVSRPGMTKVIAVGASGSETRIAIVQPK